MRRIAASRVMLMALAVVITSLLAVQWTVPPAVAQNDVPGRPTDLTATATSHDTIALGWTAPSSGAVDHYRVLRKNMDQEDGRFSEAATTTATSYTDQDLEAETRYRYRIQAVDAQGAKSRRSRQATATTPAEENPPAKVRNSNTAQPQGQTTVTVSWTAPEGAERYQVERRTGHAGSSGLVQIDTNSTATTYLDTDTAYNTHYRYRVRAGNNAGYGAWSDEAEITTAREPGTPAAPADLSAAEHQAGTITITWSAPAGDEAVDGYRVHRRDISGGNEAVVATTASDVTEYDDSTVAAESWYSYWVVAHNSVGDSPKSRMRTLQTQVQSANAPNAPTRLSLTEETAGQVVISWQAPADGPEPDNYLVYRSNLVGSNLALIATVEATSTEHTDDSVDPEKWYAYRVKAANSDGESRAKGPEAIKTKVQTPGVPNPPTSLGATEETAGEVVITWTAPTEGPAPTGYKIYRQRLTSGGDQANTHIGTTENVASYTDDTVAAEVLYFYTARAVNDQGDSSASRPVSITTKVQNQAAPDAPEDTSADQQRGQAEGVNRQN